MFQRNLHQSSILSMDSFTKKLKGYLPVSANDNGNEDIELGDLTNPATTDGNTSPNSEPSMIGGCFDLTYSQKITGFAMSASAGALFFVMSSFMVGGILVGQVSKFATCYLLGNIFLLCSTLFLVGCKEQLKKMFEKKRLILTCVYFGTLTLAMYLTFSHSSMFLILPTLLIQFVSLVFYIVSYLPGGISAINFCSSRVGKLMFKRTVTQISKGVSSSGLT